MKDWKMRLVPLPITWIAFFLLYMTKPFLIAKAFLLGACITWGGEFIFSLLLFKKMQRKKAEGFFTLLCFAESMKLLVYGVIFVWLVIYLRQPIAPVLSGFIFNLILFWFLSFKALGDT